MFRRLLLVVNVVALAAGLVWLGLTVLVRLLERALLGTGVRGW